MNLFMIVIKFFYMKMILLNIKKLESNKNIIKINQKKIIKKKNNNNNRRI